MVYRPLAGLDRGSTLPPNVANRLSSYASSTKAETFNDVDDALDSGAPNNAPRNGRLDPVVCATAEAQLPRSTTPDTNGQILELNIGDGLLNAYGTMTVSPGFNWTFCGMFF